MKMLPFSDAEEFVSLHKKNHEVRIYSRKQRQTDSRKPAL